MSTEANKAVVRRMFEEVFNQNNVAAVDDLVAADAINHAAPPAKQRGPESMKELIAGLRVSFPDTRYEIEDMLAEGDRVAVRATWRGTHLGPYRGIAATGKSFEQSQLHIFRVVDGRWVEHWAVRDELGQLQQLGIIPSAAPAAG